MTEGPPSHPDPGPAPGTGRRWRAPRTARPARPARARREPLTPQRIARAALAIIDAEGSAGVTMRRVAGDLGVTASSLYEHVRNRDDLLQLVLEEVDAEFRLPLPTGDWQADLRAAFRQYHGVLTSHGDLAALNFATIPGGERSLRTFEGMLRLLLDAGLPPRVAIWGLERLALYTTADAYERWEFARRQAEGEQPDWEDTHTLLTHLDPAEFPALSANVEVLIGATPDEMFATGLDLMIAGMAALARSAEPLA